MVRRLLAEVRPEKMKSQVILKYEIGLSRVLMNAGHRFATFVEGQYPYHPLYTSDYFELAAAGFPLLKRNFIAENALDAPDLAQWKERVTAVVPDADVEMFERNLLRVSADDRLQRSFAVRTRTTGRSRSRARSRTTRSSPSTRARRPTTTGGPSPCAPTTTRSRATSEPCSRRCATTRPSSRSS